jgi:predicted nucleotidyltransferase
LAAVWKRFWKAYDWLSRADFANTLAGGFFDWRGWLLAIAGSAITFLWSAIRDWDPLIVWLSTIGVGAGLSIIYSIFKSWAKSPGKGERADEIRAQFVASGEKERREIVTRWLIATLSDSTLRIDLAFLFGSVVHDHYPTSDVDLLVEFEPTTDRKIGSIVRRVKESVAHDFQRTFGHKLHVTFFASDEADSREAFLNRAGNHSLIFSRRSGGS